MLQHMVQRAQSLARTVSSSSSRDDTFDQSTPRSAAYEAAVAKRQLAALKGELEGTACKLEGFRYAMQEMESQLATKDLTIAMLKSVITEEDDASLRRKLLEATDRCEDLQSQLAQAEDELHGARQELQQLQLKGRCSELISSHQVPGDGTSTSVPPLHEQANAAGVAPPSDHTEQLALLHKALALANAQLRSLGMPPVPLQESPACSGAADTMGQGDQQHMRLTITASRTSSLSLPSEATFSPHGPLASIASPHNTSQRHSFAGHDNAHGGWGTDTAGARSRHSPEGSVVAPATPPSPSANTCFASEDDASQQGRPATSGTSAGWTAGERAALPVQGCAAASCSQGEDVELGSPYGAVLRSGSFIHAHAGAERRGTTCVNPLYRSTSAQGTNGNMRSRPCSPNDSIQPALARCSTSSSLSASLHTSAMPLHSALGKSHPPQLPASSLAASAELLQRQLLAAKQALAAIVLPAAAAKADAYATHAELRRTMQLLTQVYEQLKDLLEQAGSGPGLQGKQARQARLASAIGDLAQLAKHTRGMGARLETLKRVTAQIEALASDSGNSSSSNSG